MEDLNFTYQVALNLITSTLLVTVIATYFISPSNFETIMKEFKYRETVGAITAIAVWSLLYVSVTTTAFIVVSLVLIYGLDYFYERGVSSRSTH